MLAMIGCVDLDDCGNDLRVIFQFNRQLQADPNHPVAALTSQSEQSSGSEGGDASQDQRPLRLQELEEGACYRWQSGTTVCSLRIDWERFQLKEDI